MLNILINKYKIYDCLLKYQEVIRVLITELHKIKNMFNISSIHVLAKLFFLSLEPSFMNCLLNQFQHYKEDYSQTHSSFCRDENW